MYTVSQKGYPSIFRNNFIFKSYYENSMVPFFETPCRHFFTCAKFLFRCVKPLAFFAYLEPLVNFIHTLLNIRQVISAD